MRVRKKPRHEVIVEKKEPIENVGVEEHVYKEVMDEVVAEKDSVASVTNIDMQTLQVKYEKELSQLKEQIAKVVKPTKNEEKILSAIKSEQLIQKTSTPTIGRNLLMREYDLRPKYLDKSIQSLLQKGLVKRTFVKYSATQNTSKWEVL